MTDHYLLPCQRCGGPHRFDTSVPSAEWNRVIRRAGLPEFLCTTCVIEAFAVRGVSFTASLHGPDFSGLLIEVLINSLPARTAEKVQEENNELRCKVRELESEIAKAEGPCRTCGNEQRDHRGFLSCECPAPRMKPWYMISSPSIRWRDRLRILLGLPLWVRFNSPDGNCHAACSFEIFVQRECPIDQVGGDR